MTKRTHDVQVPGAPTDDQKPESQTTEVQDDLSAQGTVAAGDDVEALKAQVAALQAENAALKTKPAKDEAFANPSGKYADVHSSKVDKTKITAPVLCKDGWLVP